MTCPKCNNSDQIQKLSSIVSSNTRKSKGSSTISGHTDISGRQEFYSRDNSYSGKGNISGSAYSVSKAAINTVEQSDLARMLMPPPEPIKPTEPEIRLRDMFDNLKIISVVVFVGIFLLATAWNQDEGPFTFPSIPFISSIVDDSSTPYLIAALVGGILGYMLVWWYRRKYPFVSNAKIKQRDFESGLARYEKKLVLWKKAYARWNDMYYCFRDDIVFIPMTTEMDTPENTISFCYKDKA